IVPRLLEKAGVPPKNILVDLDTRLEKFPKVSGAGSKTSASQRLVRIFQAAEEEAVGMDDAYISTEHFLFAMVKSTDSDLASLFKKSSLKLSDLEKALKEVRGHQKVTDDDPE